ncbi:hypothetical protein D3C76_1229240 [compost metagenome]
MAAAFLGHLILHMDGGHPAALEGANGAGDVEGAAPAGVDVHQERHLGRGGDALCVDQHVVHGGHAEIRQAEGGVRHPGAGEVEGLEAAALGHQRHVGVDGADDLQGLLVGQGCAKTRPGRG